MFKIIGRDDMGQPFTSGGDVTISTGDYFDVFEIPIIRGRRFNERDDSNAPPVVVINRALAERWWPDGRDPVGERTSIGAGSSVTFDEPVREVIGIVDNVRKASLDTVRQTMYLPLAQIPDSWLKFNLENDPLAWVVRTDGDPMQLIATIEAQIEQSTGVSVSDVQPIAEIVAESIARQRANMLLMTVFGGIALLLAAIGIYGLVAFSVQQRTHEIGIRMALGAQRDRVVRMVVREGMLLVAIGIAVGLVAAFFLADLMDAIIFGVAPRDFAVFVGVPSILVLVAAAAVLLPAAPSSPNQPTQRTAV